MSKFISPLNDIVFKTLWLRADEDLKEYLNRLISYSIKRDISNFKIGSNETGIVNVDNIANEVDILLENGDEKIDIELNNIRDDKGEATIRKALIKMLKLLGRDDEFMSVIDREEYRNIIFESSLEHYKEQGLQEGIEEGIEKGIKKGLEEGLQQGFEKGIEEGIEKGVELGREESINKAYRDIVLTMSDKGYLVKEIADILNISLDKVQNILNN